MKKIFKVHLFSLICLVALAIGGNNVYADVNSVNQPSVESATSIENYNSNIEGLRKIDFATLKSIFDSTSEQSFTIYFGRPTCYYCRLFSPTLKEFNQLMNGGLIYYDTSGQDFDSTAQQFVFDELGIPGTPTIIYVKHGQILNGWVGGDTTAQELMNYLYK